MKERFNAYRTMWIHVSFDLPTETKTDRRNATQFRKRLLQNGFAMFQYSIYLRYCASRENAKVHKQRIQKMLPPKGQVCIMEITDKQFGMIEIYHGKETAERPKIVQQLELF